MYLIIGGAYQGKLKYARERFGVTDADVCVCTASSEPDYSAPCIYHLERFAEYCLKNGLEPKDVFAANEDKWSGSVLISDDISCGVVPIDPELRAWREAVGRLLNYLSPKAEGVVRLFCSIPQVIK